MAGTSQIECCQVYEAATVVIPVLQRRELRHREVKYLSKVTQLEEVLGIKPTGAGLSGDGGAGGQGRVVPAGRGGWEGEEQRASGTKEDSTAGAERARKDPSMTGVAGRGQVTHSFSSSALLTFGARFFCVVGAADD